jgi:hypothetical protein
MSLSSTWILPTTLCRKRCGLALSTFQTINLCRYECAVNISDLITLQDVMDEFDLGPNGGLVYCMEYLEKNLDWLQEALKPLECETGAVQRRLV